jgi:hypothetical protein
MRVLEMVIACRVMACLGQQLLRNDECEGELVYGSLLEDPWLWVGRVFNGLAKLEERLKGPLPVTWRGY